MHLYRHIVVFIPHLVVGQCFLTWGAEINFQGVLEKVIYEAVEGKRNMFGRMYFYRSE